jgi:hypothetical protein
MTHPELQAALARVNITIDASEAHGWLTGALCARTGFGAKEWLTELALDAGAAPAVPDAALRALPRETLEAFRSEDFEFAPLLPDEDAPLGDRVAALAAWAEGFLVGIGSGISQQAIEQAGDVGEFLRDLAEIAHAGLEPGRDDDASEGDFAELFEFVRAGAQLAFDELAGARAHAPG